MLTVRAVVLSRFRLLSFLAFGRCPFSLLAVVLSSFWCLSFLAVAVRPFSLLLFDVGVCPFSLLGVCPFSFFVICLSSLSVVCPFALSVVCTLSFFGHWESSFYEPRCVSEGRSKEPHWVSDGALKRATLCE